MTTPQTVFWFHEYFHVLEGMYLDPFGQSDIIHSYIEEAKDYKATTTLKVVEGPSHVVRERLHDIEQKFINILEGILNDGALPLDVAFCRLIILLPYVQPSVFVVVFVAFFFYFIVGSCFPSLRKHIKLLWDMPEEYEDSKLLQYLMDSYFPNLNHSQCIKFKYYGNKSTHAISSVIEEHIANTTEYGDPSIASIICDFVQYQNQDFVHFICNFLSHFRFHSSLRRCTKQCINFVKNACDGARNMDGHLLSRLLISQRFIDHNDDRLKYEAHHMALMTLSTGKDIAHYFKHITDESIGCDINPQLFIELFEFSVANPWRMMRDAILNHSLLIFFNGNNEERASPTNGFDDLWYKQMIANLHYVFKNIIHTIPIFDSNDMELSRKVFAQFENCYEYFRGSNECEGSSYKNELMDVLWEYLVDHYFYPVMAMYDDMASPARKKRRLNRKEKKNIIKTAV
eukprot:545515_1